MKTEALGLLIYDLKRLFQKSEALIFGEGVLLLLGQSLEGRMVFFELKPKEGPFLDVRSSRYFFEDDLFKNLRIFRIYREKSLLLTASFMLDEPFKDLR